MQTIYRWRELRMWQRGSIVGGLALIGLSLSGLALGAAGSPKMQVLPHSTDLKYKQIVEVKAQNLPKGSGTIALTICGLNDASGKKIAKVTADDCAGANDLNSGLVKLQSWKDGTFDQKYQLPSTGQKFGKNQRFCDRTHYCVLVVADANPNNPAYEVSHTIYFNNQKTPGGTTPTTKPKTTTTKKKPATTTTTQPTLSISASGSSKASSSGSGGSFSGSGSESVKVSASAPVTTPKTTPPTAPPVTVPAPAGAAVTQACDQLASAIKQGGGDPTALTTACSTLVNGGGGTELGTVLQSPSVACLGAASATQNNQQIADACSQLATALQPYSSQLGTALTPVLNQLG